MNEKRKFVWLGGEVYVPEERVVLVAPYEAPAAQRLVEAAKTAGRLIDLTDGDDVDADDRPAVVLLQDDRVVISTLEAYQIVVNHEDAEG